ncbi:MAG: TonB-dependent receptor [Methylococcales bacterium]|nr:TonB-dependent receptor [Methylococcales bacterium]
MTRHSTLLALTIFGILNTAYAEESAAEKSTENVSEGSADAGIALDSMTIYAAPIEEAFEKTKDVRKELGMATDGADLLKKTAGVSVIRQGGTASDPMLRGLGSTRLNIAIDGVPFTGACNHRMDPATAYVTPGSFDNLTLLKGPQSVKNGGSIAGTVNFERDSIKFEEMGFKHYSSYLYGSFNQQSLSVDTSLGFSGGYISYSHNNTRGGNYIDGNGQEVGLTFYDTRNDRIAIGFTPDDNTLFEISGLLSEGQMGNATIHMDVTRLDRSSYGAHFKKSEINSWLKELDIRYNYTHVNHAMDNYSLRQLEPFHEFVVMGQYWNRHFAKVESTIEINPEIELVLGAEYTHDSYDANAAGGLAEFVDIPDNISQEDRNHILDFDNIGIYGELSYEPNDNLRMVSGLRVDSLGTRTGLMHAAGETIPLVLSGSNKHRRQFLFASFLRMEYNFDEIPLMFSMGYGHAERAADYWEVYSNDGFDLKQERNNEVDLALAYQGDKFKAELSGFYSHITDFILVHRGDSADNIVAQRVGAEFTTSYALHDYLTVRGQVSYVHGRNLTQNVALAQTPPLEGTIGLNFHYGDFTAMINTRLVQEQKRVHASYGNSLALDTTPTIGFITSSLELGYKPHPAVEFKFGMDNIFDKTYTEHLNRNASASSGGPSVLKLNEPGRSFWGRISIDFDYPS